MKKDNQDYFSVAVANTVKYGMILFIVPVMVFAFGWLGGLFVKWVFGDMVVHSLNLIFNTNRFTTSNLPSLIATIALIGGYFHYRVENKVGNKESK